MDLVREILASLPRGRRVSLTTVRAALSDFTRAYQDRALVQLQRDGALVLYREDNNRALTAADRAAALSVGGSPRHLVYITV